MPDEHVTGKRVNCPKLKPVILPDVIPFPKSRSEIPPDSIGARDPSAIRVDEMYRTDAGILFGAHTEGGANARCKTFRYREIRKRMYAPNM
jgi:hypothetical protein